MNRCRAIKKIRSVISMTGVQLEMAKGLLPNRSEFAPIYRGDLS